MFMDLLIIFIVLSVIFLILSIVFMESDKPSLAIPFIMLGMIFIILCAYGCWNVEIAYTGTNITTGGTDLNVYSTVSYGDPYSFVFVFFFFVYLGIFFRTGYNMWKLALEEGGVDTRNRKI